MTSHVRSLAVAALAAAALAAGAAAQTAVTPVTPDPQAVGLVDRVASLEQQLQAATAENERLQHDLALSRAEVDRLTKALAEASGQPGDEAAAAPPPAARAAPAPPAAPPPDPASAFKSAYDLVAKGDFGGGATAFRAFLKTYPSSEQAPEARFWLGQTLLAQGDNPGAAEQFLNVVKTAPKSAKAADSYLYLGVAFKKMGQKDQACAVLKDVPVKYPSASTQIKQRARLEANACPA
jgi:tol-pal system protein YbgF